MRKEGKILLFVLLVIIVGFGFWEYRHPDVKYTDNGKLEKYALYAAAGYTPKDIEEGVRIYTETLREQYAYYEGVYNDFEVYYDTQIGNSKTVITFEGEGVLKETGETESISDTVTLDFEVYEPN